MRMRIAEKHIAIVFITSVVALSALTGSWIVFHNRAAAAGDEVAISPSVPAAQVSAAQSLAEEAPAADAGEPLPAAAVSDGSAPQVQPVMAPPPQVAAEPTPAAPPLPGRIILHFQPETTEQARAEYIASIGGTTSQTIDALNVAVVTVPETVATQPLPESPVVATSEPDYQVIALDEPPSDPRFPEQWALPVIGAPGAWADLPADAPTVSVAVIDSGICADHPDLSGRIVGGWDFVQDDGVPQDDLGHGCAVAGVIAANTNNGIGIAGVAPNTAIIPLRVIDAEGVGAYSDVAAAIVRAAEDGAAIINLSLGGTQPSAVLEEAVSYAASHGVTLVAAAGNTSTERVMYPAAYEPVIAVGSIDADLGQSSFSTYGPGIDLWAPGGSILTTSRDGDYGVLSGTSMAAPHVTGVAALEMARGGELAVDGGIVSAGGEPPGSDEPPAPPPPGDVPPPPPDGGGSISIPPRQPGANPQLSSSLNALNQAWPEAGAEAAAQAEARGLEIDGGRVKVMLIMLDEASAASALDALPALGGEVTAHYSTWIDAWVPIDALDRVAALPGVSIVQGPIRAMLADPEPPTGGVSAQTGAVVSQGVSASNADLWQSLGVDGWGVNILVTDWFQYIQTARQAGEAPSYGASGSCGTPIYDISPHGTAVVEVIYDMAPRASYLLSTPTTATEMASTISNCWWADVVSSSIVFYNAEPGDGTGPISNAVAGSDALFVQAAGNSGLSHWDGAFLDSDEDDAHEFAAGGVEVNQLGLLQAGVDIPLFLRWNSWLTTYQDYDLYIVRWNNTAQTWEPVAWSENVQNGTQPPTESIYYTTTIKGYYGIVVLEWDADGTQVLDLIGHNTPYFQYNVSDRSLVDSATSADAFSVAAVDVDPPYALEPYSSWGPTHGPGGSLSGGIDQPRIAGYANVDTWIYGAGAFNGTSAATPHVSGAAVLVLSAWPGGTAEGVRAYLESSALDMGTPGYDYQFGTGRLLLPDITFCDLVTDIPETECDALTALYESTGGDTWEDNTNWFEAREACTWYGITCSGGHVTRVDFNHNNLVGSIPSEIGDLSALEYLRLASDPIDGPIPPEIGDLSNLRELRLYWTGTLDGSIPPALANLSNLEVLSLNGNQLSGGIPPELGSLTNLTTFSAFENQLTGEIPLELASLSSLEVLGLGENELSGSIPAQLGSMSSLRFLHLYDNQLSGSIPLQLGSAPSLLGLYLADNDLGGDIPPELANLPVVQVLDLSGNHLTGSIPPELGSLTSLRQLYLSRNQIGGSIPPEFGNLTDLNTLDISNCQLSGDVPSSLTALSLSGSNFGYNMLTASDPGVATWLASADPDWAATQTVPPGNIQVTSPILTRVTLSWTPIAYTADGGYYQIAWASSPGGPYMALGNTSSKTTASYVVNGLEPNTPYYFVVRAFTPAHGLQQNALLSPDSQEASASTPPVHMLVEDRLGNLYAAYQSGGITAAQQVAQQQGLPISGSNVMVVVLAWENPDALAASLRGLGATIQGQIGNEIHILLPINRLVDAANLPDVRGIMPQQVAVPSS